MNSQVVTGAGGGGIVRRLALFPVTAEVTEENAGLAIGGLAVEALAEQYGTPLHLYDAEALDTALGCPSVVSISI